jgi:hypothetical protein
MLCAILALLRNVSACSIFFNGEKKVCSLSSSKQPPRWICPGEFSQPFHENPHPIPMALKALEPLEQFSTDVILNRSAGRLDPQYQNISRDPKK